MNGGWLVASAKARAAGSRVGAAGREVRVADIFVLHSRRVAVRRGS
jgi:hypothetical protein